MIILIDPLSECTLKKKLMTCCLCKDFYCIDLFKYAINNFSYASEKKNILH